MSHFQEDFFKSFDGTHIFYRMALPQKATKGVIIFVHGWSEHSGCHEELIESFVNAGFGVYAPDLRGHGHSKGQRGYISKWDDYLQDLYFLTEIAQNIHKQNKIFLVGHSMGCAVSIRFVQTYAKEIPMDGLILSAPMLRLAINIPKIKIKLGEFMSKWIPHFSLPNPIPGEQLTHDPEKIEQIKADPLFHFKANSRWYTESQKAMHLCLEEAQKINIPTLILHGTEDEINAMEGSQDFFEYLAINDKEFVTLDSTRHNLFHELNRKQTFSKINIWITQRS